MKALVYWMVALMVGLGACTSDVDKDQDDDDDEIAEWDELMVTLEVSRPTTAKFRFTSEASNVYQPENFVYPSPKVDFPTELEINWGDGQTTNSDSHEYQDAGTYLVKIKGKGIGTFNIYSEYARIKKKSVKSWPNLVYLTTLPDNINFTLCPKLENYTYTYNTENIKLDFSKCPKLKYVFAAGSKITDLNITGCTELKTLECYQCKLTKLDVSTCTELEILDCSENQLINMDLSKNTKLTRLKVYKNQLTNLDVSKNTKLFVLEVGSNQLVNLDVSKSTELAGLYVNGNQLTNLNLSNNTELTNLYVGYNQLTNLDVSKNTKLEELICSGNQLTDLNINGCSRLSFISCSNNQLNYSALNQIYNALSSVGGVIYIGNNPDTGDTYIATQKRWEVTIQDF